MLNPIDTAAVIRDGGAVGRFPGQIHESVAWWIGACFVVVTQADQLVVGRDAHPATAEFFRRFCRGAINAQHYACTVTTLPGVEEPELLASLGERKPRGGAYLQTTHGPDGIDVVRIHLYNAHGQLLGEDTGLGQIRRMIAEDHAPIPVNYTAKGHIERAHGSAVEGGLE